MNARPSLWKNITQKQGRLVASTATSRLNKVTEQIFSAIEGGAAAAGSE